MRVSEEALYASDPLGSVPPEQIRAEILATGAPPQMTKDGPKPPTKKMIAAAAARKDSFLRAALDARRTRDAPVDWLVAPVCLGVLRRESSSPEHVRLAVEIVREATAIAPEDEPVLAEGSAPRPRAARVAAAAFGAAPSVAPGAALGGGSSSRATAHLQVLAACPRASARSCCGASASKSRSSSAGRARSERQRGGRRVARRRRRRRRRDFLARRRRRGGGAVRAGARGRDGREG